MAKPAATLSLRLELLSHENYDTWKIQVEALFTKSRTWGHISGEDKAPAVEGKGAGACRRAGHVHRWLDVDHQTKADLILAINPSELKQIKGVTTAHEIWNKLESIYASRGPARKALLLRRLTRHVMQDGTNPKVHLAEFSDAANKLLEMDVNLSSDVLAMMLLDSLPESYDNFRCAMESRDMLPDLDILKVKIIEEHNSRVEKRGENASAAMFAKPDRKFSKKSKDCASNSSNSKMSFESAVKQKQTTKAKCNFCGKKGHVESVCRFKKKLNELSANQVEKAHCCLFSGGVISNPRDKNNLWCIDSGCTSHLCKDKSAFTRAEKMHSKLKLANDSDIKVTAKGDVQFITANSTVTLKNTLHVPELRTNLISVAKIVDNDHKVTFEKNRAIVQDSNGAVKLVANRIGDLFYLCGFEQKAYIVSESRSDIEEWHARLGHLNSNDMLQMLRNNVVTGLKFDKSADLRKCETCLAGKMSSTPFVKSENSSKHLLELIHSDVCGPMRVNSQGGARYFATFIDDYSRWCQVYFLQNKSEVAEKFAEFKSMAENQTGHKIKAFQSDNGREYCNEKLKKIFKDAGIQHRLTTPHTPQQNGAAERKNRTLVEAARCMLIASGTPPSFWAEAICAANHIRNRCPTKGLTNGTPFEKWTGQKADISHLRTFGSKVFILDKSPNKGKFDPRGIPGIFVGYSDCSKAYRVWVPGDRKIHVSRDTKFLDGFGPENLYEDFSPTEETLEQETSSKEEVEVDFHHINPAITPRIVQPGAPPSDPGSFLPMSETKDQEDADTTSKRSCGRPRFVRTGKRGRPAKLFNTINHINQVNPNVEAISEDEVYDSSNLVPESPSSEESDDHSEDEEDSFYNINFEIKTSEIPIRDAINGPDKAEWFDAIYSEMKSLIINDTWKLVSRPIDGKVIDCRTVLRNKYSSDGSLLRRKARVVARGFSQRPGIDFKDTFAPVARIESLRLLMALAVRFDLKISQLDITTAYLNGDIDTLIFMEQPHLLKETLRKMIQIETNDIIIQKATDMLQQLKSGKKVCKLNKAIYGLKQAGRQWHAKLSTSLKSIGLDPINADPCIYVDRGTKSPVFLLTYVDDIVIVSGDETRTNQIKRELSKRFDVKDLGNINYCLGIEVNQTKDKVTLCQSGYISDILRRFNMEDCKSVKTPIAIGTKFEDQKSDDEDTHYPFRELIGALMYLAVGTRPDIAYAVNMLSQFNNCHNQSHWQAAKRILRYLQGTIDKKITYSRDDKGLIGYADADWGNCHLDRRSYTGYNFNLSGSAVSWCSRKQRTVALSSTEAEYMCLTEAAKEAIFLSKFVQELGFKQLSKIVLFNDNQSAGKLARNPVFHARSKHIDIRFHFIRHALQDHPLELEYLPTENMIADVMTKPLSATKHEYCVEGMGLHV